MTAMSYSNDDERRPLLSPNLSSSSPSHLLIHPCADLTSSRENNNDDDNRATSSFQSCRHCLSTYVPIEPLLFGYTFARLTVAVLTGFYFFDQASKMYGDPSMNSLNPCGTGNGSGPAEKERAENVEKEAIQMTMIAAFSIYMTAVLPTLFLGPLIDRLGRRLGFVLPVLGVVARTVVFLIVLGTRAPVYYVYIGTVLEGLGGGFGTFFMTTFSAAADVTEPGPQRALRICIIEAIQVLGSALATFIAGQWRRESYEQPVIMAATVGVFTLIYALWGMPETHTPLSPESPETELNPSRMNRTLPTALGLGQEAPIDQEMENQPRIRINDGEEVESRVESPRNNNGYFSFSPTGHRLSTLSRANSNQCTNTSHPTLPSLHEDSATNVFTPETPARLESPEESGSDCASYCSAIFNNIRRSWSVYFRSDDTSHPARRCVLVLCFVCFLLTVAVNFSKPSLEKIFRMSELCWDAVQESEFESAWVIQHWIFILVALHVLQGRLNVRNVTMAIVGCVSALCAPLIFSFATLSDISEKTANILVFASAGSGTLARALIPMLRAMSSAVVSLDEQGALFASYACVELAGAAVFDLAASQVYKATVHLWKGIIYVIMTSFFVVVLFLLIVLSGVQRRAQRNRADTEMTR